MSLNTYADLLNSVAAWSKRSDLASIIPDCVVLAEARINRDLRMRRQIVSGTLTTVAGSQAVTLPADFLEFENLTLNTNPKTTLSVVTPELLDRKYPEAFQTGAPVVYTTVGNEMRLGPTPDAAYTITADYYAKWSLQTSGSNWLLTNHPYIYLSAVLAEVGLYTMDTESASQWAGRYQGEVKTAQDADDQSLRSGSAMRVRTL